MTKPVENNAEATSPEKGPGGVTGKGFMPGKSGNPGGRAKNASLSKAYRHKLESPYPDDPQGRSYAEVIADAVGEAAAKGDLASARELADRAEGRAMQGLRLDVSNLTSQFEMMSASELQSYAETGVLPKWFNAPAALLGDGEEEG